MVITRSPYRLGLFGGGSDYGEYFRENRGAVLSFAISRYCYLTCRRLPPFFSHRGKFAWSKIETVNELSEIEHPAIRGCLQYLNEDCGLAINHDGDLPARSGMGSSAAFTVGLLHALHALRGEMISKRQLALEAIEVDQDVIGDRCGIQDQVAASFGGFNRIDFKNNRESFEVQPITMPPAQEERLLDHMLLFYTGVARTASEITAAQIEKMGEKKTEMADLVALVDEAWDALAVGDIESIGPLLHESWVIKRSLSPVITNDFVDSLYERARRIGATGGKLCGAGAGGAILIFIHPDLRWVAIETFKDLVYVPFRIDRSGSQVIYYQGEG